MRVAVLRCERLPRFVTWEIPEVEALFDDDRRLIAALQRRGVDAVPVAWSADVDWSGFDLAVVRSTWDYVDRLPEFLAALERIERSGCRVRNPLDAIRWNSDKRYLDDLATRQVPVVPTVRAAAADADAAVRAVEAARWTELVVKPAVGVGGGGVTRVPATRLAAHLRGTEGDSLVQPFVPDVVGEGEFSYVVIGGQVSHVLRKRPATGDFRAHGIYGGTVEAHEPAAADLRAVRELAARLPFDLDYARFDLVRREGRLAVLELELIEPMLYLASAPGAEERLAAAVTARPAGP
ncbi:MULTISPECIES: ATP-grasp domain-containing protein [unclassified Agromyces]|uniref:ATP-grasp domain-containing protein n=1 Tax=unclassified Agromyces TaxID=2639701 RepID=UPI003014B35B